MSKVAIVVLAVLVVLVAAAPASATTQTFDVALQSPAQALRGSALDAYGRLPLAFEPNRGQFGRRALFAARGPGYSIALTRRGAVIGLSTSRERTAAVEIGFIGASRHARVSGSEGLAGTVNYLHGADRSKWRRDVPTFRRVGYRGVWRGIDAVFYGRDGQLEYDFEVAPGADPGRIGLSFAGARSVRTSRSGALVLRLRGGTVRQLAPVSYQLVGGTRRAVPSRYVMRHGRVGVRVGAYDRTRRLVIDPVVLAYSTFLGGSSGDDGYGVAVDGQGAAYVAGQTSSTDFPTTAGVTQPSDTPSTDAFVSKIAPDGSGLVYSTYLGGSTDDGARDVAIDALGAAYVVATTGTGDFPITPGAADATKPGSYDVVVSKLEPDGSDLAYSTYVGGADNEFPTGIAVDGDGAAYATGYTSSTDFTTTTGAFDTTHNGGNDAFVTKVAPDGSSFGYSTYLGAAGTDEGAEIAVDSAGAAHVVGETDSLGFPTTTGALDTTRGAQFGDVFVTKVAPAGDELDYSTFLGGGVEDIGQAIALDGLGAAYVTGFTGSTDFPVTAGAFQTAKAGGYDAFVSKLALGGGSLVYSTYLGAGTFHDDTGGAIAVDSRGAAWVGGDTNSTDFPVTPDAHQSTRAGNSRDAYASRLAPDGSALEYSTYLGGLGNEAINSIAIDADDAAYMAGETGSEGFPTTSGVFDTTHNGSNDTFVLKLAEIDNTPPAPPSPQSTDPGSPGESTDPLVIGSSEAGTTVRVYTSADCSGTPVATGSAADFASPGLPVTVAEGSTTTFYATATDTAGNLSACSTDSTTYTQESPASSPPPPPPPAPPAPLAPTAPPVAAPVAVPPAPIVLPTQRRCASRRAFAIRLPRQMRSATVKVAGRKPVTAVRRGGRLRSRVDLRGLPRRKTVVRIVGRTSSGRVVRQKRVYHPCATVHNPGRTRW